MGRSGDRRRKRRQPLPPAEASEGIIEDLHDQAAWSSFTQGVPRLGNSTRDTIWWNRPFRFWRGVAHARENRTLHDPYWWTALRTALLIASVALIVGLVLIRLL